MWIKIYIWAILAYPFDGSLVIDRPQQDSHKKVYEGINIKDYCPKMKHCPEGSHTMCLYFNPDRIAGPRCSGFKNISMTPEVSELILDYVNEMRGRVATGTKETIQGGVLMPRGYGMFKLKWDKELATFAQVLANTCMLRHDMCRATLQFPSPSQLATIVRFSIKDWNPLQHLGIVMKPGLNEEKITYAVDQAYSSWYTQKQHVTLKMLEKAPDYTAQPTLEGRAFLQLIAGDATHIGCGISSYVEYHYKRPVKKNAKTETIFNTIHIICNLSADLKKGTPVYKQAEPSVDELCKNNKLCKKRYNSKCGCPPGTDEDDRCLCTDPITYPPTPTCEKDKNCKPAVVLLPIFTVEDAPQHLISRKGSSDSELRENGADPLYEDMRYNPSNSKELDHNEVVEKDYRRRNNELPQRTDKIQGIKKQPSCQHKQQSTSFIMNSLEPPYSKKRITDLYQSEEEKEENTNNESFVQRMRDQHANRILPQRRSALTMDAKKKRGSIFSKAPKFELPTHKTEEIEKKNTPVKTDVAPRKDFSKAKQALNEYLNEKKRNSQQSVTDEAQHSDHDEIEYEQQTEPTTVKATLKIRPRFKNKLVQAEHRNTSMEHSKHPKSTKKNKLQYLGFNIDSEVARQVDNNNAIEEPDKKLMSLLDNLEQEAKHVDLDGTDKEIFDVKLKKIYGTVVKKSENLVSKQDRLDLKEDKYTNLSDEEHSEFERERHVNIKQEQLPYKNKNLHKNIKTDRRKKFQEEIDPYYQRNRENSPKYVPDLDEPVLSDGMDDPNRIEFDEQMYNTDEMVSNLRSSSRDNMASQSLYARPLPRDQNTLRPTMDKMDYVFRNTFNDVHDVKSKIPTKNKSFQRYRNSEYIRSRGNKFRVKDDVKVLPYHLQYKRNEKRDKYRILNKYNAMKDKYRNRGQDDEKGTHLNRIDEKRARYDQEIVSDYEDDKQFNYNNENRERYEENYGRDRDYREDLLSSERRKFYQEKLDHIKKRKYSANEEYFRDPVRRRRPEKHILGIHRRRSNLTQHFYVPNRASRHNF